jgi:hypothetical protein
MKSLTKIVAVITVFSIFSLNSNRKERVFYLPFEIPGSQMAATIPPFGIFIEDKYRTEGSAPGSILAHERIHWNVQYKSLGLFGFYTNYLAGYVKHGRKTGHPMEIQARLLSK